MNPAIPTLPFRNQTASDSRYFVWDGERYFLERSTVIGSPDVEYTQEPAGYGGILSQRRFSGSVWTPSYYLLDVQGSTVALADASSAITDTYLYDIFGLPLLTTGSTANPFRWVGSLGYYYDEESQEYYLRARTYGPWVARFISQDPLGFDAGDWNLFRYVMNNPVNGVDPSGLRFVGEPCSGCLQKYSSCIWKNAGLYAACLGQAPLTGEIGCAALCAWLGSTSLEIAFTPCFALCSLGTFAWWAFITKPQCDLALLEGEMKCGNKYNQCAEETKGCCANWKPD